MTLNTALNKRNQALYWQILLPHTIAYCMVPGPNPQHRLKIRNFVLFYLPYLSSIHEKANCIAILWTGSPHSLGSCLFRGLWATCLPHKGGAIPLSALPKDTTSELAGLFSTTSPKCRTPSREAADAIF